MTDELSNFVLEGNPDEDALVFYSWRGWVIEYWPEEGRCELRDVDGNLVADDNDFTGVMTGCTDLESLARIAVRREEQS